MMRDSPASTGVPGDIRSKTLKVNEIFYSLQGETTYTGLPTVFIRLTGCPLRCVYCDTEYAFYAGEKLSLDSILKNIAQYNTSYVTVTGGEPLAQKDCLDLLTLLCNEKYIVNLETSGAMELAEVDKRVCKIMDIKTPGSGEEKKNNLDNFQYLTNIDQIKFVICNRNDYEWSRNLFLTYKLEEICEVLFSPSFKQIEVKNLADWILQDRLNVRLQVQLHKLIWGDIPGK